MGAALAMQHGRFVSANPGLSMEEQDLEQVLPSTRPTRSCRDSNHGRPYTEKQGLGVWFGRGGGRGWGRS